MLDNDFKDIIESFLRSSGISPSTFGRRALGDPTFVNRIRRGARCWPETKQRCLDFIKAETEAAAD